MIRNLSHLSKLESLEHFKKPHRSHSLTSSALLILKVRRCCTTAVPLDPLVWCVLEFSHVASLQSAHDATILLGVFPGKKKSAPEHQNALEPKEVLWIPHANSQWKHMETMKPKQM